MRWVTCDEWHEMGDMRWVTWDRDMRWVTWDEWRNDETRDEWDEMSDMRWMTCDEWHVINWLWPYTFCEFPFLNPLVNPLLNLFLSLEARLSDVMMRHEMSDVVIETWDEWWDEWHVMNDYLINWTWNPSGMGISSIFGTRVQTLFGNPLLSLETRLSRCNDETWVSDMMRHEMSDSYVMIRHEMSDIVIEWQEMRDMRWVTWDRDMRWVTWDEWRNDETWDEWHEMSDIWWVTCD